MPSTVVADMIQCMEEFDLRDLVEQGESHRLEFKSSLSELSDILETLAAFRNADGGDVLIGVEPNGAPSGRVTIGANTLERLVSDIQRDIDPAPFPRVERGELGGKAIIRVTVEPRRTGYVYFVRRRAKVRVGRTNQDMSATEIRERHREGLEPPALPEDWSGEENAPVFDMRPAAHNGMDRGPNRINVTFTITGVDVRPRYRWIGEGVTNDWVIPMAENPPGSRKWTTPPIEFSPPSSEGVVSFEAVFRWRGAECHARWDFPYSLVTKNSYVNVVFQTQREHLIPQCWRELARQET